MPYTKTSLAMVWLVVLGLVAVTGSGVISGAWLLLLVLLALAAPALVLGTSARAMATSRHDPLNAAGDRARSAPDHGGVDLSGWENEGGAQRLRVDVPISPPIHAAR
jgi:hypothetical protein